MKLYKLLINILCRWSVTVTPISAGLGFRGFQQQHFMYNYMSVGVDAQVALNFHRTRESRFYLFSHRIFNKVRNSTFPIHKRCQITSIWYSNFQLLYLCFGGHQAVERECKDLDKQMEVYLDGEKMDLPSMEGIVILNIPFWAAGVDVWNIGSEGNAFLCIFDLQNWTNNCFIGDDDLMEKPSINDGKLEVFCLYSSFHIAQLSVGLSRPHRLGQARTVKVRNGISIIQKIIKKNFFFR